MTIRPTNMGKHKDKVLAFYDTHKIFYIHELQKVLNVCYKTASNYCRRLTNLGYMREPFVPERWFETREFTCDRDTLADFLDAERYCSTAHASKHVTDYQRRFARHVLHKLLSSPKRQWDTTEILRMTKDWQGRTVHRTVCYSVLQFLHPRVLDYDTLRTWSMPPDKEKLAWQLLES